MLAEVSTVVGDRLRQLNAEIGFAELRQQRRVGASYGVIFSWYLPVASAPLTGAGSRPIEIFDWVFASVMYLKLATTAAASKGDAVMEGDVVAARSDVAEAVRRDRQDLASNGSISNFGVSQTSVEDVRQDRPDVALGGGDRVQGVVGFRPADTAGPGSRDGGEVEIGANAAMRRAVSIHLWSPLQVVTNASPPGATVSSRRRALARQGRVSNSSRNRRRSGSRR